MHRTLSRSFPALIVLLLDAAIASAEPFTFAVIGDYGTNNTAERDVANLVKSWDPSFILTLGDNNYSSDPSSWDERVGQYYHDYIYNYKGTYGPGAATRRFFPNIGNHDYDAGLEGYLEYFDLPGNERYYTYRHDTVEFFVLNSNSQEPDGISKTSKQATWLQSAMAASDAKWKVVTLHHPPYASGSTSSTVRWPYEEWGADVVMAGHLHNYERLHVGNIDYFINGLGGAGISGFGTTAAGSEVRYKDSHGAMKVTANDSFIRFQFINKGGEVIDDYTIGGAAAPVPKHWNTSITHGAWNDPANWSPAGVPEAGHDAFVVNQDATDRTVDYVNSSGGTDPLNSLTLEGRSTGRMTLRQSQDILSVVSLNVAATGGADGTFEKSGGTLAAERVVNQGTFRQSGGSMRISSSFENAGGVAEIGGDHRWDAGATMTIAGGTVRFATTATTDANDGLTVDVRSGGTAHLNASQYLSALAISGGAVSLPANGGIVVHTGSLAIEDGGSLNLADNAMILRRAADNQADDLARIEALVAAARNGEPAAWTANGITSSSARADANTTLAVVPNPGLSHFNGEPVGPHDILIGYTLNGDANLDGRINFDDYFLIDNGILGGRRGFANGDFNYDGSINFDDYFLIDQAFLSPDAAAGVAASAATVAGAVVSPEPSLLAIVMAACTLGLRRRWR